MSAGARRRGAQAKRRQTQASHRKSDRRKLAIVAGVWAVVAVAALVVLGGFLREDSKPVAHVTAPSSGFILGSPDAPVLITAWEDFQCPACKAANSSFLKQVETDYVATGDVRIQYRQFPFLGQESVWAAEASQCAADQGKFWDYESALFAAQRAENSGVFSKANLKKIAAGVGIDPMMFDSCVDNSYHKDSVQAEKKIGEGLGINSTPTFFVNNNQVRDWRDYTAVKALIDQALTAAGKN